MTITSKQPKPKHNTDMTAKPDYHNNEEFQNRTRKLAELKELGIDPYPHKFTPANNSEELIQKYLSGELGHSEDAAEGKTESVVVAGRLMLFRSMGKNAFAHIQDATGRIQIMFNRDSTQVTGYTPANPASAETLSPTN